MNGSPAPPQLVELYAYVTDACTCRCRHCWIVPADRGGDAAAFLEPELFEAAVAEAIPLGLRMVKWTGGEPTLHPHLADLLAVQRRHGLAGRLETNGMDVTPKLAGLLAESGVTTVAVSLDGAIPATHDAIRGVAGGHRRAMAGFAALRGSGFRPQVVMSLMRANAGEVEALLDLAADLGAGSVKLNVVQPTLRGKELHAAGEALSVAEVLAIGRRLGGGLGRRHPFPVLLDVPLAFRPLADLLDGGAGDVCGIFGIIGLLAGGTWAICGIGLREEALSFGRVGEAPLRALWNGHPVLRKLREGLPGRLEGVCGRCLLAAACLGSCVALNFHRSRRLLAPHWFCEEAERLGLFPATRLRDGDRSPTPGRPAV